MGDASHVYLICISCASYIYLIYILYTSYIHLMCILYTSHVHLKLRLLDSFHPSFEIPVEYRYRGRSTMVLTFPALGLRYMLPRDSYYARDLLHNHPSDWHANLADDSTEGGIVEFLLGKVLLARAVPGVILKARSRLGTHKAPDGPDLLVSTLPSCHLTTFQHS